MGDNCKIEWVVELARQRGMKPRSWNPVIGCSRASEGCRHCYAAATVDRFARNDGTGPYAGVPFFFKQWGEWGPDRLDVKSCRTSLCADGSLMWRVGKRAAGRLLGDREWNEAPAHGV